MKSGIPHLTGQYFENELGSVEKANVMSLLIKVAIKKSGDIHLTS
jgi:hypothetical protein